MLQYRVNREYLISVRYKNRMYLVPQLSVQKEDIVTARFQVLI